MKINILIKKHFLVAIICFISVVSFGQGPLDSLPGDPGAITVTTIQNLSFGSFSQGATGGKVIVSPSGVRSVEGSVTALNLGASSNPAVFEIQAPPGSIVSIGNGADATLTGSNGGTMSLVIGASSPMSPFNVIFGPPAKTQLTIGGSLTVGPQATSPPGTYTGSFYITFNLE